MAKTPTQITTNPDIGSMTEVWMAEDNTGKNKKQIFFVQEVPQLKTPSDPITYTCLENDEELQAKGIKKAADVEIPVLYTEEQHDDLSAIATAETEKWFFFKLPDRTAKAAGKPLVFYFSATLDIANDAIAIEDMIQETVKLYRSSNVFEMKGLPAGA